MLNYYDFLITVRYLFHYNDNQVFWKYQTIKGSVIAGSEQGAKELIEELFTGDEDVLTDDEVQILNCEIVEINPIIPSVVDYSFVNMHYESYEEETKSEI